VRRCIRDNVDVRVLPADCYNGSMRKIQARVGEPSLVTVDKAFDYFVFHSPYNKLVQQSFARIQYNDVRRALEVCAGVRVRVCVCARAYVRVCACAPR
jgi:3-hydroxy-3-methylglutaryl CoA synthase